MKKISTLIILAFFCSITQAAPPLTVGLWEQLAIEDGNSIQRHDVVFVSHTLSDDTTFSALRDVGETQVLCCIKVKKDALITLPDFLKKYKWEDYSISHLKSIKGWKYVYEATLVDPPEQNSAMRDLVESSITPPSISPYSAAVVSSKIARDMLPVTFYVGGTKVSFTTKVNQTHQKRIMHFKFSVDGSAFDFSEEMYPHD